MANKTGVFLAHSLPETAAYISALLRLEPDIRLVGSVGTGSETLSRVRELKPEVVLVDSELPDVDSVNLVQQISAQHPYTASIALVSADDPDVIRRYMQAGARSFLIVPFGSQQLVETVREVDKRMEPVRKKLATQATPPPPPPPVLRGKIVSVFGPKGGVGKTMLAVNLAVALRRLSPEHSVALVDGGFSFGDLHLFLNIKPEHTIYDLAARGADADVETLQRIMQSHSSGVRFLARPTRPEEAEVITTDVFRRILDLTAQIYDCIVVDCPPSYEEKTIMVLDRSELILLVITPEVGALYNAGIFLNLAHALGYPKERIQIIMNRFDSQVGISISEAESALAHPISHRIASRGRQMATTLNVGEPIYTSQPGSEVARSITLIAEAVLKRIDAK